ncbi:KxYKxGKxW signal peptide domain-containing protein, partial [Streptococcus sp. HMSC071D03]|uniref:KxYKxGKxW signal peptide domain-containing protein n=1 Tax=Streptococcus sp. HMSC071D03 TaxID=1739341 RepID=UPI000A96FA8A
MYFNRKNAEQKNWRMIKKGKHFLFGCSLVFAVGATLVAPSVKADTVEAKPETSSTTDGTKPVVSEENPTYAAPAVEVAPVVATGEKAEKPVEPTQNSEEEPVVATEKAKEADSIQAPEVTVVYNPAALTDEEKAKVVAAVKAANPTATDVQVQADGSVVVAFADGSRANLTAAQTIKDGSLVAKPRTNRALRATAPRASEGAENLEYTNKKRGEVVVDDYIKISYKVDNAKNVIHWTTVVNGGRGGNAASGYTYFTVPKDSVGTPTNWNIVQTDKNGKVMSTRTDWKNNDGSYVMGAKGKTNVYTGDEMTKKLTQYYKNIGNPALKGKEAEAAAQAAARSQALYTLTADVAGGWLGKNPSWTITYDTPILDKSKPLDYVAGLQGTGGTVGAKTEIMTGYMDNFIDNASSKFQAVAVKENYTAKVGGSFAADPATYVTNKAGTPEFPNNYRGATSFKWKDGQAPTATEAGTYTKTVVVTYPAHYKQAPQEVTITFEVKDPRSDADKYTPVAKD